MQYAQLLKVCCEYCWTYIYLCFIKYCVIRRQQWGTSRSSWTIYFPTVTEKEIMIAIINLKILTFDCPYLSYIWRRSTCKLASRIRNLSHWKRTMDHFATLHFATSWIDSLFSIIMFWCPLTFEKSCFSDDIFEGSIFASTIDRRIQTFLDSLFQCASEVKLAWILHQVYVVGFPNNLTSVGVRNEMCSFFLIVKKYVINHAFITSFSISLCLYLSLYICIPYKYV